VDGADQPYARMYSSSFNVGAKGYGKPFSEAIAGAPAAKPIPKGQKPQYAFKQDISEEQAIIYRLSGGYNPLHIEPAIGISAGFGGSILHGLSTFGFVARGILAAVGDNDLNGLKGFGCQFTILVKLGGTWLFR